MKQLDKKGWKKVRFGDVCRNLNVTVKSPKENGYDKVIGLENIESGNLHISTWGDLADGTTFTKTFEPGHVLFGKRRAYLKKAAVAEFKGLCSGDILVFEAVTKALNPKLLPFIVSSDRFFEHAIKNSAGSLSPRTKFQDLANFEFSLPPVDQQEKFADFLWAVDTLLEKYKNILDSAKSSYYSFIEETIIKESENCISLSKIINYRKGLTYNSEQYSDINNGLPLINLKTIERQGGFNRNGIKYYNGEYLDRHIVKPTDLIIACTDITRDGNVIGYPLNPSVHKSEKMLFTMDLVALEVNSDFFLRDYIYYLLQTSWAHKYFFARSPGTTVLHLNIEAALTLEIPIVDLEYQYKCIKKLGKIEALIDKTNNIISSTFKLQEQLLSDIF
jgi:type I restriction enzyme S subunit